jgi:opacity protein-like surface antigen
MKKIISFAIVAVMVLAMAIASSADLVSEIKILGTTTAPVLDGNVTAEEWGEPIYTVNGTERKELQDAASEIYTVYAGIEGQEVLAAQTTGKSYMRWDANNLYLAYVVAYPYHNSDQIDGSIWGDSCVQTIVVTNWPAEEGSADTTYMNELGFSLDADLKTIKTWRWYPSSIALEGATVAIVRKGTETSYEIALPWEAVLAVDPSTVKEGLVIGVSSAYNFKDENLATLQYQVGGSLFGKIASNSIPATLVAAPVVVAEEVPEVAEDSSDNPPTTDISVVMYILATLSTLGGAVVINKRK